MLLELALRNFRCFRDAARLSLIASSDRSLPGNVLSGPAPGAERILASAVIYGANASGKSTVLSALRSMQEMVLRSGELPADAGIPFADSYQLDSESQGKPTEFEVIFAHGGTRYQYGFAVRPERVVAEWLFGATGARQRRYYERSWDEDAQSYRYRFGPALKGQREKLRELTRSNALYLSTGAMLNHELLSEVYSWFSIELLCLDRRRASLPALARFVELNSENRRAVAAMLERADVGITGLSVEVTSFPEEPDAVRRPANKSLAALAARFPGRELRTLDVRLHHKREDGSEATFNLERESDGTRQLLLISPYLLKALQSGGVVLIDEIDSSLHPLLVRALVSMFHDEAVNVGKAQLVCTTHDATLLDMSLLRRDQVWFTEKDGEGVSHLYSLLEYKPRKDTAVGRGYLAGRYGAVPLLVTPLLDDSGTE